MLAPLVEHWDTDLRSGDPLGFPGYAEKLAALDHESVTTGLADGFVLIEGEFEVIGGSMGLVHGEKVVRAFDRATERRLPIVIVTRSGGARMQEGMLSLVQMARTSAAAERHRAAGLLAVAVHRSPTTGGVFASYGSLCDLAVVEAGAVIGFAGPRVVEQAGGGEIDGRSHSGETAAAAHLVDAVADAEDLLGWVEGALGARPRPLWVSRTPTPVRQAPTAATGAWAEVLASRAMGRPSGLQVAAAATTSWTELAVGTDDALRTALATIADRRVVVIACDRYGGDGRPRPAGYRVARRGIALAERLGLPVLTLIDTPGAASDVEAENDGIAREIAGTFAAMATVTTPTIGVCVGEGGSGGALALGATDRLMVQAHATFSVIAPEGAATILERDASKAAEMAASLRLTSADLLDLGVVDAVVPDAMADTVAAIVAALDPQDGAQVGQREARFDAATDRWLRTSSSS